MAWKRRRAHETLGYRAALLVVSLGHIAGAVHAQESSSAAESSAWTIPANESIRRLLAERMQQNGVGIVVGVIEPGGRRVVAHGRYAVDDPRRLDGDTVFQIGSLTKTFTGLLLSDMVERGDVTLDDPASKYLPAGVRMPERGRPITLFHLATHMSGLPSMPTNYVLAAEPDSYAAYSVDELHQFLSTFTLPREPGAQFRYSNLGVSLLGRLLSFRLETDYESLLRARVLEPLGLESTSIELSESQTARLAPGHDRYLRPVHTWEMRTLPASGSLRSTVNDLLSFISAYLGYTDTPLKSAMKRQLAAGVTVDTGRQMIGWGSRSIASRNIVGHDGGKQGYRSGIAFDPESGTGVVVLANARTDDTPINLAVHLLTGRPLKPAPPAPRLDIVKLDRAQLETYAGQYRAEGEVEITIARKDEHLLMHVPGNGIMEFYPSGQRDFFLNTGNDELTFEVDQRGRVIGFVLYGDSRANGRGKRLLRMARGESVPRGGESVPDT